MRLSGLFAFVFLLFFSSCKTEKKVAARLDKTTFTALLIDIYLAEARLNSISIPHDSASIYYKPFEKKLLANRNIQDTVLQNTYAYYIEHPREFEEVFDAIIDSLNLREQKGIELKKEVEILKKLDTAKTPVVAYLRCLSNNF